MNEISVIAATCSLCPHRSIDVNSKEMKVYCDYDDLHILIGYSDYKKPINDFIPDWCPILGKKVITH